jgi:uncharacterized membrane-anchored protein YhcB (DUF1043 family)
MKKIIITALLCACQIWVFPQNKKPEMRALMYGKNQFYSVAPINSKIELLMSIDKSTKWVQCENSIENQPFTSYAFMEGCRQIKVIAFIPKKDIQNYRYSIIEDDTVQLAADAGPAAKLPANDGKAEIDLGNFDILNKKLRIEIYSLTEKSKVNTVVIYNKPIAPVQLLSASLVFTDLNNVEFATAELGDIGRFPIHSTQDKFSCIRLTIKPNELTFLHHVYIKNLSTGRIVFMANNWIYNGYGKYAHLQIDASYFTDPGDYQLIITPGALPAMESFISKYFPGKTKRINFTVLRQETIFERSATAGIGVLLLGIGTIIGLVIYFIKKRASKKLLKEQRLKNKAQLELSTVRSQLNPHFMFNALSGIQNLMNKNDVDQANRYLAKFARITRRVLDGKELTSLTDEKALLDDYLQMEQLRFGFNFEIVIDESLNAENIEIPAMLLQPFAENAVKHGIADMGKNGYIYITMNKDNHNILLGVRDNGKGFDKTRQNNGLGIQLIERKVALLNDIFPASLLSLNIQSACGATTVLFTLNNWL